MTDLFPDTDLRHLNEVAASVGTPFYLYDASVLRARLDALRAALPAVDFFYSLKSNPNLSVAGVLHDHGAGCEVSSLLELETSLRAGATPDRILMVGPGKSKTELGRAVELGIKAIVVESAHELTQINQLAGDRGCVQDIALRVNPDFHAGGAKLNMSGRPTQFGIDQAELPAALTQVENCSHLRLCGLHAYMGTRILSHDTVVANVRNILDLAAELMPSLQDQLDFVDVGGGFGIPYYDGEEELDLDALGREVTPLVQSFAASHPQTRVVIELGRYLSGPSGQFVTRVQQIKHSKGESFAVCDGGSNVHVAAAGQGFLRKNFPIRLLRDGQITPQEEAVQPWTLTGPLCTPQDVIGKSVPMAAPKVGDLISIGQSGAYGPTASPVNFLGFGAPAEVMIDGASLTLVRGRDTVDARLAVQHPQDLRADSCSNPAVLADLYSTAPGNGLEGTAFAHPCLERLSGLQPLFRETGARLDRDPESWTALWENPTVRALTTIGVPEEFNGFALRDSGLGISDCPYGLHVAMVERLARFDANCILALPGPSLSGGAVLATGTEAQIARFFDGYRFGPQGTFFAVTEPNAGSDASNGRSTLGMKNGQLVLNGVKTLVGGIARADIGLFFAHIEETGRMGLVMIRPSDAPECVKIERLSTNGLRGADLCQMTLRDFPVTRDMILGSGGRSLRDGFMAINGVFERNRPMVAAMALGSGRGLIELMLEDPARLPSYQDLLARHTALLVQLVGVIQAQVSGRPRVQDISRVKMQAVSFVDEVVRRITDQDPMRFLCDAELRRRCRDVKAFEYMEGTSNIHLLNAYRSYAAGVSQ
ncbi:acyl-CoA dehydrogenase family protein [Phaeobacter gallaeciensis]|uniref:Diaminopimelate decarboxylase n=1 Tax=Phaeobacter gallaeciensis TaxID=60890 RepID=A0AAD0ED37_9RHOB|nr:acyl-CoA dehydrogenase family protein [Phaeobacter gallaeciensis]AHD09784.1 Diaminopimelate decarboxylase [Phaeobacter gallaeciensis DSM 26640]ATE93048.1 Diaminopimelate decarboxylase [Phaeobacter gallaeciensis]ATE97130.1 Diaminopimelate decarboxylase [Phaeobacter gallaeciensis]ATF01713.1 Diaminopimelate decarboxylase [Phaeobacter gallaeciensis]ATF06093.1 Diaminopimelate decarboxylase [Phaeobacter gallaeciensis]